MRSLVFESFICQYVVTFAVFSQPRCTKKLLCKPYLMHRRSQAGGRGGREREGEGKGRGGEGKGRGRGRGTGRERAGVTRATLNYHLIQGH